MPGLPALRTRLRQLADHGSLPRSLCGRAFLQGVAPLLDSGVLAWGRSGGGECLQVRNPQALLEFTGRLFPGTQGHPDDMGRIRGVLEFRDTKALAADTPEIVIVRAWANDALFKGLQPVPAAAATADHGVFAFVLDPRSHQIRSRCALVENPAVLLNLERIATAEPVPLAMYAGGRVSGRLVDWLAHQSAPDFHVVHFPDYDPVGLSEFARLHQRLGPRVDLFLPDNLEALFERYSNPDLLRRGASRDLLPRLRTESAPGARRVLALIERHNAGLEQEALLA